MLNDFSTDKKYKLSDLAKNKGAVIVFIDPDKEPSTHVMVDIAEVKGTFEKWNGAVLFVIPSKSKTTFNPSMFTGLPKQSIYIADNKTDDFFMKIENQKGCSLVNKYPVVIYVDKSGKMFFYSEGYRIGVGEQILKVIMKTLK